MQFAVHLYPTVRVKVTGIEADSVAEAVAKAEGSVNLHDVLDNHRMPQGNIGAVEWDDAEKHCVLVDPLDAQGEPIEEESTWLDGDRNPLVDGKTAVERKTANADDASLFMQELLDSVETLCGIAEVHGPRTLADLMYLQSAVLNGGFIDHSPGESAVLEIAQGLPSGERWVNFVKIESMTQRETAGAP